MSVVVLGVLHLILKFGQFKYTHKLYFWLVDKPDKTQGRGK